ncbi:MAG: hypothetical protein IKE91_06045 [Clostridia bacterium]|nr:hypothetical protein [Clostridia bacterium]
MNNNNIDVGSLMKMLAKMDKKDLANGMSQLNTILKSNDKDRIINELKNNLNKK